MTDKVSKKTKEEIAQVELKLKKEELLKAERQRKYEERQKKYQDERIKRDEMYEEERKKKRARYEEQYEKAKRQYEQLENMLEKATQDDDLTMQSRIHKLMLDNNKFCFNHLRSSPL